MRSLVVIPTYNEKENIEPLVQQIMARFPGQPSANVSLEMKFQEDGVGHYTKKKSTNSLDILFVDDGSPDGTSFKIQHMQERYPDRIHLMQRAGKLGLGTAYVAGFQWGLAHKYDCIIEMDADFSHPVSGLDKHLELLKTHDFSIGSRYVPGGGVENWGLFRRFLSKGGSLYARLILGVPIRDFTGGFNGWRAHVLNTIHLNTIKSNGYSFQIELKYRAASKGYRFIEFPIHFANRVEGVSKMNKKIILEALVKVWRFRLQTL